MTTRATAYTPLEQLLVFQALRAEGANSHHVFSRISDQLQAIPLIRNDASYDSGRLSPDALRELYFWLLKEEVKVDLDRRLGGEDARDGASEPGSKKRKQPSPKLATVQEARQHAHLIPQLVTRLYARYREVAVRDIRETERRYDTATREIGEIEAGKWDERLQRQRTASATQSPRPSSKAHTQPLLGHVSANKSLSASPALPQDDTADPPPKRSSNVDALLNHGPEPQNGAAAHSRNSSSTTLPPLSEMAPQSPRFGIPPKMPAPPPPQVTHGHPYGQSPTHPHQPPYSRSNGVNSPQVQQSVSRPSSSSSAKPFLPPPHGMTLPPPTPPQYHSPSLRGPQQPPHAQHYAPPPQHRLSTSYSPTNDRGPMGYPPPQPQPPPNYYHQQQPYDRRASYPVHSHTQQQMSYGYPVPPPHQGGYQMQPFSVEPQDSARSHPAQPVIQQQQQHHHQARLPPHTPMQTHKPPGVQYVPYPPVPSTVPRLPSQHPSMAKILSRLGTPDSKGERPGIFKRKRPSHLVIEREIPSPVQDIEPFSPVQKRADPSVPAARALSARDSEPAEAEPVQRSARARGRPKRERSPHSVVSSTANDLGGMHRSQSVSTADAALAPDSRPASRGDVKPEPSTPAEFADGSEVASEPQSAASGKRTRKRRGTVQSLPQPFSKRRRRGSLSAASDDRQINSPVPPSSKPSTVTATRNFQRATQTMMNTINSHKHASYFANAVREKDAPGYGDIIKVPQNLKSIRTAISAGSRAVNAAASSTSPAMTGSGADGAVELDRSVDLMPPKAIVNAAQLEKEVMRMFANAIMFNPGEDGLVMDTREMADDVEDQIRHWRGFETDKDELAEDETAGVEEEGRSAKRRKI